MPERPHLRFPIELGSGGRLRTVEQDSDDELACAIAMILAWPEGSKREAPGFGAAPTMGESGGADLGAMRVAVERTEPRVRAYLDNDRLTEALETVHFGFGAAE